MGNAQSTQVYRRLAKEIPPVTDMGYDSTVGYADKGFKAFADARDREQFIYSVITVATSNGLARLDDHDFKVLYARRSDKSDRIVARIVAIKDGVVVAKIEPEADGKDQAEAFKALKKDVEIKLDRVLASVPDRLDDGNAAATSAASASGAPPAYSGPGIFGGGMKKS